MTDFWSAGFPHSEIHGSRPVWRLPVAYRSLLRPSSLADAQASTVRPLSLNHRIVYDPNPQANEAQIIDDAALLSKAHQFSGHALS